MKTESQTKKFIIGFWLTSIVLTILVTLLFYHSSFVWIYLNYGSHAWESPKDVIEADFSEENELFEVKAMEYYKNEFGDEKFHQLLKEILKDNKDIWSLTRISRYAADIGDCSFLPDLKERCDYLESIPYGLDWSTSVKLTPNFSRQSSNAKDGLQRNALFAYYRELEEKCNQGKSNTFESSNKSFSDSGKQSFIKLDNWNRKHYKKALNDPVVLFWVYGDFELDFEISKIKYRTNGFTEDFTLTKYDSSSSQGIPKNILQGNYWEEIRSTDRPFANQIYNSEECFMIMGEMPDRNNLNYLRDIVGLITYLLDHGGVVVFDAQIGYFWKVNEWKNKLFEPNNPVPTHHIKISQSVEKDDTKWYYTTGMRKFGRLDLSIHKVPSHLENAVTDLIHQYIEFQALGGIIKDGQLVENDSLPAGMWCENRGGFEDPDFYNKYVEIHWP